MDNMSQRDRIATRKAIEDMYVAMRKVAEIDMTGETIFRHAYHIVFGAVLVMETCDHTENNLLADDIVEDEAEKYVEDESEDESEAEKFLEVKNKSNRDVKLKVIAPSAKSIPKARRQASTRNEAAVTEKAGSGADFIDDLLAPLTALSSSGLMTRTQPVTPTPKSRKSKATVSQSGISKKRKQVDTKEPGGPKEAYRWREEDRP